MAAAPQPSINFHARIDLDTEERRRRLQNLSASRLVSEAFRELEQQLNAAAQANCRCLTQTAPPI